MRRPYEPPSDVRGHESHEAYGPGRRHRRGRERNAGDEEQSPLQLHARAQAAGHLVAEGQVILEPIPSAEERLVRELPPDYGYFEGFATDPQRQGEGLGRQIIEAVEGRARSQGKQGLLATVRAENGPSIGALLGQGYSIVDYDPAYYEGEGGARLIVGKRLDQERSVLPADQLEHAAMADDSDSLKSAVDHGNELVAIPVENGDDVDSTSQELIATALENGYVGTTIRKPSRWTSDPGETRHLLVFEKVER